MDLAERATPQLLFAAVQAAVLALVDMHHGGPVGFHAPTPADALVRMRSALEPARG